MYPILGAISFAWKTAQMEDVVDSMIVVKVMLRARL